MKRSPPSPRAPSQGDLRGVPYEDVRAARSPVTDASVAAPRRAPHRGILGFQRLKRNERLSPQDARTRPQDDGKRFSGLAPTYFTARDSRTTVGEDVGSTSSIKHSPSLPVISSDKDTASATSPKPQAWNGQEPYTPQEDELPAIPQLPFMGILTEIPTGSFEDLTLPGQVEFSKRGSMLIGGKKVNSANGEAVSNGRVIGSRRLPNRSLLSPSPTLPTRILSADDEVLSNKVRSMYEVGGEKDTDRVKDVSTTLTNTRIDEETDVLEHSASASSPNGNAELHSNGTADHKPALQPADGRSKRINSLLREDTELAGGIEDWEDLNGDDVDRYGFIVPRRPSSQPSTLNSRQGTSPDPHRSQRISTLLQLVSETPRRQRSRIRTNTSARSPARSAETFSNSRPPSGIFRPTSSQSSYRSTNGAHSRLRNVTNRLPHNKDRRCVDEAGDMLTLPPGLADIAEDEEDSRSADELKRREWEREEKWRKMGKLVKGDRHGGGMVFDFDTRSPKVIERTWKGIPDRWRATAWHSFLSASATTRRGGSPSDSDLIAAFKSLLDQASPDDVQIDIDVPRTINSHIMFRRRYRGGQRLLFRVLHCLSIYFPDTGYVQGMAALAATLLCYYDEEMTFVMLVRLWQLRGLERLYQSGFEGLMQALEEFEQHWLGRGEVAKKLTDLNIPPTSYGTRWYLTLFNYSIPFPAQLRVWDIFMLLGDPYLHAPAPANPAFNGGLDILHATSAALIAGTRDILLDSDFESAMKVLTSWIPVKDEEMLMRVAHVEWKGRRRR